MGGYPLFADSEIGLASPTVLLALLTLPPDVGFVALRLLHLAIAALGTYALGARLAAATVGRRHRRLTFALGSFVQAHLHHENIVRTAAWLPLVLACLEHACGPTGEHSSAGSSARRAESRVRERRPASADPRRRHAGAGRVRRAACVGRRSRPGHCCWSPASLRSAWPWPRCSSSRCSSWPPCRRAPAILPVHRSRRPFAHAVRLRAAAPAVRLPRRRATPVGAVDALGVVPVRRPGAAGARARGAGAHPTTRSSACGC